VLYYYAPAPRVGALSDDAHLTFVCLSSTSDLSREQRPRKTKIGTEVAHVTRNSDTTFKVKRSKVNLQGAGAYCGGLPQQLVCYAVTVPDSFFCCQNLSPSTKAVDHTGTNDTASL